MTIRLSSGERPVLAPEYAVKAPVEVIAEPVSYTRASSYKAATEGLAIYDVKSTRDVYSWRRKTHNGDAVVVNMGHFMELFLDLGVLALWPEGVSGSSSDYGLHLRRATDLLNTTWMKIGLVDAV